MSSPDRSSVGRYELRERLGAGGMGTVWHAWDPSLQRDVAIKEVLLPEGMSTEDRAEARARTMREAQATARISDTAVVTVHDVLEHDDSPWIVMELLRGASLQHHLDRNGPMPVERVEEAAKALLGGLRAAHAAGVTHRDVKPANIMLTDDDRTVLTDFGIANVDGSAALTQTGVYIGSPEYMAPERFEGERALPASDMWSLGVTLYSLLEGRSPFKRDSITGIISAVLTSPMPPRLSVDETTRGTESAPLKALIGALLDRDVSTRPGPDEALDILERAKRERERARQSGAQPGSGAQTDMAAQPPPRQWPPHPPQPSPRQRPRPLPPQGWAQDRLPQGRPRSVGPATSVSGPQPPPGAFTGHHTPTGTGPTGRVPLPPPPGGAGLTGPHVMAGRTAPYSPMGHAGTSTGGQGSWAAPGPAMARPAVARPASVIIAAVMSGVNALYLLVLAALAAGEAGGGGTVAGLGVWGLFSGFAVAGLMTRSRLVYGIVVLVQLLVSVVLVLSMFSVFIYHPEQLVFYVAMLLYNLGIAGLLLIPPKARAYFGFGVDPR